MKYEIPLDREIIHFEEHAYFKLHLHNMVRVENKNLRRALADTHSNSEHTHGHTHSQFDHNLTVLACYCL